jgi:hypothetical protein
LPFRLCMCTAQIKPSSITGMQQKPPDFSLLFCGRRFFVSAQFWFCCLNLLLQIRDLDLHFVVCSNSF